MEHLQSVAKYKAAFVRYTVDAQTPEAYGELSGAACDLTRQLQAAGWPVEAIIVLIKSEVANVFPATAYVVRDTIALVVADVVKCFYQPQGDQAS